MPPCWAARRSRTAEQITEHPETGETGETVIATTFEVSDPLRQPLHPQVAARIAAARALGMRLTKAEEHQMFASIFNGLPTPSVCQHTANTIGESFMASIKKRVNGKWQAQVRRQGHPTQTQTFLKKSSAEQWARDVENQMDHGRFAPAREAESTTLGTCLERYLKERTPNKKGASQEASRIKALLRHPLAVRHMAGIRSAHMRAYRDERLAIGLKPATVRRELAILTHVFEIARKDWDMETLSNPVKLITKPAAADGRDRRVQSAVMRLGNDDPRLVDELTVIKHFSDSAELPALLDFASHTGMRRSEIAGMEWRHVNLPKKTVFVAKTKNGQCRTVPLSPGALSSLASMFTHGAIGPVFRLSRDAMTRAMQRARQRALEEYEVQCRHRGDLQIDDSFLKDLRFHDLRHEAISRLADNPDISTHELAQISGHLDMRMLFRYVHQDMSAVAHKLR